MRNDYVKVITWIRYHLIPIYNQLLSDEPCPVIAKDLDTWSGPTNYMGAVTGVWSNGQQRNGRRKSKKLGKHPSPLLLHN